MFMQEHFAISRIPCERWMRELLSITNPKSLNECFTRWANKMLPKNLDDLTIVFDGKTIRSTTKMDEYDQPLHILSAYLAEAGLTISQKTISEKSNEIPAMRELLKLIDVRGAMVTADALHCQTETAKAIYTAGGDYLLCTKGNQDKLEKDIKASVHDPDFHATMESATTQEKNGGRIEIRTAFVSHNVSWMTNHLRKWQGLACIGAINRRFTIGDKTSDEWHYCISSRKLTPDELLKYARNEWAIESMHWLLDVHFKEDDCLIRNRNAAQNLNMIRKVALNYLRNFKNISGSKKPLSRLMFACLLDLDFILKIIYC